jgi:hypothetical protein
MTRLVFYRSGTPGATRTLDTRFRKPLLCPPELLGHEIPLHARESVVTDLQKPCGSGLHLINYMRAGIHCKRDAAIIPGTIRWL